jgi:hypothetical protein
MDSFPAPQDPQSAPSSYLRPIPGQLRGHSCVVRDAMVSDWHVIRDVPFPH